MQGADVLVTGTLGLAAGSTAEAMRTAVTAAKEVLSSALCDQPTAFFAIHLAG